MNAKQIYLYFLIYRECILDNELTDDSDEITVEDLVDYVENFIDTDYRVELTNRVQRIG
jgi:hypothetical protein